MRRCNWVECLKWERTLEMFWIHAVWKRQVILGFGAILYILYSCGVLLLPKVVWAEYNPGNICAECVDVCANFGSATSCTGAACDSNAYEETCQGLYHSTSNQAEEIWGCFKQNQDTPGGNFMTCSERVMTDAPRYCFQSFYCLCSDAGGSDMCVVSGGGNWLDSDDCNGNLYPMPPNSN